MAFQVILPKLTYEMHQANILEWFCSEGELVRKDQPLFVVETDKAATDVLAEQAGTLLKILVQAGTQVSVGTTVAWIGTLGETIPEIEHPRPLAHPAERAVDKMPVSSLTASVTAEEPETTLASPSAKRLAHELGIDLRLVQDRVGRGKRIREADVQALADIQVKTSSSESAAATDTDFVLHELTSLQRAMAERMTASAEIPQFAAACEVELSALDRFRDGMASKWEALHGFRPTYTHILAGLAARALESCPTLNASCTNEGIRLYQWVNLGVAMATERGLVVPVVRRANQLPLEEIAAEIVRLQQAAERNRLSVQALQGGTFTLTNVGMLGITSSVPLLNPPQSGILAIGAKREQLILKEGKLSTVPVATLTLVADHRVVDGATSAAFLRRMKELVETI